MLQGLNEVDYGIISIIGISVLFGVLRGFVREALSLATWVVAAILGTLYCDEVGSLFTSINIVGVRLLLAFILIVLVTLIVGGIISHLISKLIKSTRFGMTDRIIGLLFGFARGFVIIAIAVLMVKPSVIATKEMWKKSVLVPEFEPASVWIKAQLPEDLLKFYDNPKEGAEELKHRLDTLETEQGKQPSDSKTAPIANHESLTDQLQKAEQPNAELDLMQTDPAG